MGIRNLLLGAAIGLAIVLHLHVNLRRNPTQRDIQVVRTSRLAPPRATQHSTTTQDRVSFADKQPESDASLESDGSETQTTAVAPTPLRYSSLKRLLNKSIETPRVFAPNDRDLKRFERLFVETMRTSSVDQTLHQKWREIGWQVVRCEDDCIVIAEQPDQRHGRGIYALRLRSNAGVVLQVPHRFYDTGSGLIARKLFQQNDVQAVAWNTVHRRVLDIAHCDEHYINAFTRAMIQAAPRATIVQLHGFAGDKQTGAAQSAGVIVSDSTRFPARLAVTTATAMKSAFAKDQILLFPNEVHVLGGTQNRQARIARNQGYARFLHLEMGSQFRKQLLENASKREDFFRSLTGSNGF